MAASLGLLGTAAPQAHAQPEPAPTPPTAAPAQPSEAEPPASPPTSPAPQAPVPPAEAPPAKPPPTEAPSPEPPSASPSSAEVSDAPSGGLFEQAQTEADAGAELGATGLTFGFEGYMRGDAYAGKAPAGGAETKAAYGELALGLRVKKANYADAYAETRFLYGLQSEELGPALDVREAYVSGYFGPLDIRLGQQLIVWGVADVLRPTNNLMPFDLRVHSPVEDDRRKSNVAARVFLNFAPFRIEGVWIPVYRSAELPTMPVPEYVAFDQPAFPAPDLANGTEGARVHFELPGFRVSGSYLYGYAPLPGLAFSQIALATPTPIHIKRQAYDHHVVGLDFSLDLEPETTVLAEAAFRFPMHFRSRIFAPNPDLDYVVGVDRKFGSFKLIAQYLGRYTFDWERDESPGVSPATIDEISDDKYAPWYTGQDKPGDTAVANTVAAATAEANAELAEQNQMLFSQLERVQHLASLRLEWLALDDALSLSALGLMNFSTEEWFVSPKVGYRVTNSLSAAIGAEIYGGPSGTLLGTIDEVLSAGFAELRYAF